MHPKEEVVDASPTEGRSEDFDVEKYKQAMGASDAANNNNSARPKHQRMVSRSIDDFYTAASERISLNKNGKYNACDYLAQRASYMLLFLGLGLANIGNQTILSSMGYLFAAESFESIVQGKEGVIGISVYLGSSLGSLVAGPLSDSSGRRKVLLIGLLLNSVSASAMFFVFSPWNVILLRFIAGFGVGVSMPCISALASEHSTSKHRGFYCNLIDSQWTSGSILTAVLAVIFLNGDRELMWKLYTFCIAAPSAVALLLVFKFVPESFRFLAIHGQYEKARKVANRVAASMSSLDQSLQLTEVQEHYPERTNRQLSPSLWASIANSRQVYANLYKTPELRKKVLLSQAIWFLVFFSYGISHWVARIFQEIDVVDNIFLNSLYFGLAAIPGLFMAHYAIEKFSRIVFLRGALASTLLSVSAFALLSIFTRSTAAIVTASSVFNSCLITCFSAISLTTAENFSTSKRSAVIGMCTSTGFLGLAAMNLASAALLKNDMPAGLLILGGACLFFAICLTFAGAVAPLKGAVLQDITCLNNNNTMSQQFTSDDDPSEEMEASLFGLHLRTGGSELLDDSFAGMHHRTCPQRDQLETLSEHPNIELSVDTYEESNRSVGYGYVNEIEV